ncbi:protein NONRESPONDING TO OXYLIPINS 2, mitochondrial isoform X1 [Ziziphus jujuba]|uniref:Protein NONRESPONDING TO OXYLIPINS 2, mitochondrial isoform X1 n=1 Tax=Ziziphus jujuba TaxID=326968 RepID=A0A6P3ZU31_ZIZJJ|nr:protein NONRESPONDING TO OXYLIPINS 2, mitochondrial isoform X1 [Ziziphus jujuba]
MASRCRSLSKPSLSLFKFVTTKPSANPRPIPSLPTTRSPLTLSRSVSQLGCVQSLLPLHSAVSSARLTSCLGIDSRSSRSLSQELGLSVPR